MSNNLLDASKSDGLSSMTLRKKPVILSVEVKDPANYFARFKYLEGPKSGTLVTGVSEASCALLVPDNECHPSYNLPLRWLAGWLSVLTFLIKVHLNYLRYDKLWSPHM